MCLVVDTLYVRDEGTWTVANLGTLKQPKTAMAQAATRRFG
jgi:hypothetical protein